MDEQYGDVVHVDMNGMNPNIHLHLDTKTHIFTNQHTYFFEIDKIL